MKQTAIDWLVEKLKENGVDFWQEEIEMIEEAKEMEKEQLGKFYNHGQWTTVHGDTFEAHYNKTYKTDKE
jgi:hypothetical protein